MPLGEGPRDTVAFGEISTEVSAQRVTVAERTPSAKKPISPMGEPLPTSAIRVRRH